MNFYEIGDEADQEIAEGNLLSKYTVDTVDGELRKINYTKGSQIWVHTFQVKDGDTIVTVDDQANASKKLSDGTTYADKVAELNTDNGVYYATKYTFSGDKTNESDWDNGWLNNGTHVRIPPYYQLTQDGDKTLSDGSGGPRTRFATYYEDNSWGGGSCITPLTEEEAREWVEEYANEKYEDIFGEVAE